MYNVCHIYWNDVIWAYILIVISDFPVSSHFPQKGLFVACVALLVSLEKYAGIFFAATCVNIAVMRIRKVSLIEPLLFLFEMLGTNWPLNEYIKNSL